MPTYTGTTGNDTALGAAGVGADTLIGLTGNDTYIVNNLGDVIQEDYNFGTDIDTILTSVLDSLKTYSLERWANVENLTYTGTLASQLKGNALANVIKANSAASVADTLYGGGGNDTLFGYGGNDSLMGDSGNDSIDGGTGNDMMIGGTGNDYFLLDSVGDRVFEYSGGGFDTLRTGYVKDLRLSWTQQVEGLTYTGSAVTTLYGNKLGNAITVASTPANADTLYGFEGNDTLDGLLGADILIGGIGDDTYKVDSGDVVTELAGEGTDIFIGTKTDIGLGTYATTIENIIYTGTTGAAVKGNALNNVAEGGAGNDTVSGLDGDDSLFGGAGGDSLTGGNGNDVLYGGANSYDGINDTSNLPDNVRDTLNGGAGNDFYIIDNELDIVSEATNGGTLDRVFSSIDNSLLRYVNVEALVLEESSSAWFGQGGAGNDIVVGNQGSNYIDGGAGNDTVAGAGYFTASGVSDALEGGAGDDVLVTFDYGGTYSSSGNSMSLFGGAGNDLYVLGRYYYDSADHGGLDTGGTDTALLTSSGSIAGLEGVENVMLYGTGGAEDTRAVAALQLVYRAAYDVDYVGGLGTPSNATGNELANRVTGNAGNNRLEGLAGNDTMTGNDGNDTLDGGIGNDSMTGGAGNDTYFQNTGDVIVEATGGGTLDIISSSTLISYAAYANIEGLIYTGSASVSLNNGTTNTSNDYFAGGSGKDTLAGFGGQDTLFGGAGNDSLLGGTGNDSLEGGDGADTVDGGTENDEIYGGLGVDSLLGGDGQDLLVASQDRYYLDDTSGNTLRGGAGNDTVDGGAVADSLYGDAGNDYIVGGSGNDSIEGGADNDTIYGNEGADSLLGGDGNDFIIDSSNDGLVTIARGGNGNDNIDGDEGADQLFGDAGNDDLSGGGGNDSLDGGTENDVMNGGIGNDTMRGQTGNDSLIGDVGNDRVYGGGGLVKPDLYYQVGSDVLWGDQQYGDGSAGADNFYLVESLAANLAVETSVGSGTFYFNTGTFIGDFNAASDLIELDNTMVGDRDNLLESVQIKDVAGGTFLKSAEMVIFRTDVATSFDFTYSMAYFDAAPVLARIGNADVAFGLGDERMFIVDDGGSSAIFQFIAADADVVIDINELFLVAVVYNNANMTSSDFMLA